jgi:hypothetical protein
MNEVTVNDILKGLVVGGVFMAPVVGLPLAVLLARRLYGKRATPEQVRSIEKQIGTIRVGDVKEGFKSFLKIQEDRVCEFLREFEGV